MKLLSLFSGIGAFEKALDYLNINYQLVNYCEIDKYASKAYSLIHNVSEDMNLGDITKVDITKLPKDIDLISYGFPCQDISLAGKQQGMFNDDGSKTRSGLFFEALRIIEDTKPKIAIAENVKNLVSKKFNAQFKVVLQSLEEAGYNNYWKVLNAKDYGIPQNRERVFIVSIRKDIDPGSFDFPKPFKLELRLKDMLEDEVDEKYFLSDKMIEYIVANNEKWEGSKKSVVNKSVATCITTGEGTRRCDASNYIVKGLPENTDIKLIQVGQMYGTEKEPNPQAGRVYDPNGLSPTMDSCSGGNRMPKILIREATKKGYAVAEEGDGVYLNRPHQKRGVVQKGMIQTIKCNGNDLGVVVLGNYSPSGHNASRIVDSNGLAPTVMDNHGTVTATVVAAAQRGRGEGWKQEIEVSDREVANAITTVSKDSMVALDGLRIRKLTPKECFRLMAFEDKDIDCLIDNKISNTQLYKMAGNSIVVDVLKYIFKELFRVINIPLEVLERKDEFMKKTKLTINGYLLDRMFNIENLVNNEPDLFNELCEKYPAEEGINWIEVGKKGKSIKKVVETPEIKEEPKIEEVVEEPVQEVIEEPKQEFPEDFQPLYKVGEKLKIEYLDGKKRESITITSIHLNNDKTLYYYGYVVDETGEHKEMAEDWLVDHEVLQAA